MATATETNWFQKFLASEVASGVLLMIAAIFALIVANSPFASAYIGGQQVMIGPLSLLEWVNDGLMALFFLLVGLQIKWEFIQGQLARWSDRILPMVAAFGGMAVPAIVYLLVTEFAPEFQSGWAIPMATDIAFAVGLLALLGPRVPASLKIFLITLAIVDDLGAVAVIALAYAHNINLLALVSALVLMGALFLLNRRGVGSLLPYLLLGILLWLAVLLSGVHATVAGVLLAIFIPIKVPGKTDSQPAPLFQLEGVLAPWVSFAVIPIFGFMNAGVSFAGLGMDAILSPLPFGVAAGLFLGKQLGIFGALWLCVMGGISPKPAGATWLQIYGVCLLCGIGFTMSLFIGSLAFADAILFDEVKIGVLGGSLLSALTGYFLLRSLGKNPKA